MTTRSKIAGKDMKLSESPASPASPAPVAPVAPPLSFFWTQLSHTSVSISPADFSSWHDVRTELMAEAKTGFKARVEAELAAGNPINSNHSFLTIDLNPFTNLSSRWRQPLGAQGCLQPGGACDRAPHRSRGPHLLGLAWRVVQRKHTATINPPNPFNPSNPWYPPLKTLIHFVSRAQFLSQ